MFTEILCGGINSSRSGIGRGIYMNASINISAIKNLFEFNNEIRRKFNVGAVLHEKTRTLVIIRLNVLYQYIIYVQ